MTGVFESQASRWLRLVLACAAGIGLHAGVVAFALMRPPEPAEEPSIEDGAILIELSAVAVAAPAEPQDVPIGPQAEETAAVPDSPEELVTSKTEEAPILNRTRYEPDDPDLRFAVANPDQKETDEKIEAEAPPTEIQERPSAAPATPVPETTAPPPIEAEKAETAAAKEEGLSETLKKAIETWQRKLAIHLSKNKRYPHEARQRGIQGEVALWFRMDKYGRVLDKRIVDDGDQPLLADAALAILDRAGKLPAPPNRMPGETFEFKIPVAFSIK